MRNEANWPVWKNKAETATTPLGVVEKTNPMAERKVARQGKLAGAGNAKYSILKELNRFDSVRREGRDALVRRKTPADTAAANWVEISSQRDGVEIGRRGGRLLKDLVRVSWEQNMNLEGW